MARLAASCLVKSHGNMKHGFTFQVVSKDLLSFTFERVFYGNGAVIGYPSGQDGAILPAWDFSLGPARSKIIFWCFKSYNKSFIDQACSVKMAGYWPRSFFACLWTLTSSWSINTQKKNLAYIQLSCPYILPCNF